MSDSLFGSPARSIGERSFGEPNSLTDSEITESESETHEGPETPERIVVDGWIKFRDNKRWKQRWGVVTKLSPAADCLHLQLYRDSRDRYKQGQTKASLSLQHFLGVETGFTLDKESNTIAIICQDVTVVMAFDTRERLMQWQVKISCNLGDGQQFLVLVSQTPSKAKISTGPARLHVQELKFCMTSGVPPRLAGYWEIGHLRRYGVVEGRFCFEGGSRCGKGEGLYVLVTDQGPEIAETFRLAARGKLSTRRRQMARKSSAAESPKKFLHSRREIRSSDGIGDGFREPGFDGEQRSGSPFWSVESRRTDLDSNYGCGDTASVHVDPDVWPSADGRCAAPSLERCVSCISKLGAATMSRSSTTNASASFNPAWTMEPMQACNHHSSIIWGQGSDRISVSSHGTGSSGSANSEYSIPRHICPENRTVPPLPPKIVTGPVRNGNCRCCPPARPPKPSAPSPARKQTKKPPMPLPQELPCKCRCGNENDPSSTGPYENYDVPKTAFANGYAREVYDKQPVRDPANRVGVSPPACEHYDTPKNVKGHSGHCDFEPVPNYGNYDVPPAAKTIKKPCGCIVTFARQTSEPESKGECPCQRVLCWAENWMLLPYCRRGNGIENTSVPIHKVKLSGEGKMPVMNASGEIAVYATVDKRKKSENLKKASEEVSATGNYVNVVVNASKKTEPNSETTDYQNMDFARSLQLYENSKELLQRMRAAEEGVQNGEFAGNRPEELSFSTTNGLRICNKCGHACESFGGDGKDESNDGEEQPRPAKQGDYLMMEPSDREKKNNFTGYLPMFPGYKSQPLLFVESRGSHATERSASASSLPGCPRTETTRAGSVLRGREFENGKFPKTRKRSSSADSSRYLEDFEIGNRSKIESPAESRTSGKIASNSLTSLPYRSPDLSVEKKASASDEEFCERTIVEEEVAAAADDEDRSSSGSFQTLIHEESSRRSTSFIRRSSSVPCKSGNNRDSSGSNDSGVSTGSLKRRGGDFAEFEMLISTANSARRQQSTVRRYPGASCLHASLPRRSKSSDPLRDLCINFQAIKIPEKSSSAEAEVPICETKKGYFSPGDGVPVPYMDSRSTSSGTSDMSDYIETLSLSSHSSSEAPESSLQRIGRIASSTLRPRSGNEYHKIDRSALNGGDLHNLVKSQRAHFYANIGPLPEKSESPSPGYVSSSPAQEVHCNQF